MIAYNDNGQRMTDSVKYNGFITIKWSHFTVIKWYSVNRTALYHGKVVTRYRSNLVKRQADRNAHAGRSHGPPLRPYAGPWELELELRLNKVLT